jgi:hypothetical protein
MTYEVYDFIFFFTRFVFRKENICILPLLDMLLKIRKPSSLNEW